MPFVARRPIVVGDRVVAYVVHDGIPSLVTTEVVAVDSDPTRPYLVADAVEPGGRYRCSRSDLRLT